MSTTVVATVNNRGNITIPKKIREQSGIIEESQVVFEVTPQGVLMRPGRIRPVRIYTDEEIAMFDEEESKLQGLWKNQ